MTKEEEEEEMGWEDEGKREEKQGREKVIHIKL